LRIDFYRKLAMAEVSRSSRSSNTELLDRFGAFGDEVRALLIVTEIRIRAEQKGIVSVETESTRLKCLRARGARDDYRHAGNTVSAVDQSQAPPTVKRDYRFFE
jgi:transcription-repair coupling factor (superfamily II helicase)